MFDWQSGNSDKFITDLSSLHDEMVRDKKLPALSMSQSELITMRNILGDSFLILTGYLNKQPATSCLVLGTGNNFFYMVAATGRIGRETSAAYAMIETLLSTLKKRNTKVFDFGGIDPVNPSASGVNHFKCGFGGEIVEHLGEWESAKSERLRLLINIAIRLRGGRA
jgi:lipid II:glycine glycyltransferase (peptidoglycan interpeptide bridge formation enzyme)